MATGRETRYEHHEMEGSLWGTHPSSGSEPRAGLSRTRRDPSATAILRALRPPEHPPSRFHASSVSVHKSDSEKVAWPPWHNRLASVKRALVDDIASWRRPVST